MEIFVRLLYNFAIPPPKNPKIVMGKLPAWKHYITKPRKSECEARHGVSARTAVYSDSTSAIISFLMSALVFCGNVSGKNSRGFMSKAFAILMIVIIYSGN